MGMDSSVRPSIASRLMGLSSEAVHGTSVGWFSHFLLGHFLINSPHFAFLVEVLIRCLWKCLFQI